MSSQKIRILMIVTTCISVVCSLQAGLFIWDGGGTDGNWSTAENWVGDLTPSGSDDTEFGSSATGTTINISGSNKQTDTLRFTSGALAYTFTGGNAFLMSDIIVEAGVTTAQTFSTNLWVAYNNQYIIHNGSNTLALGNLGSYSGNVIYEARLAFSGSGDGTINDFFMTSANQRSPRLEFNGSGTWEMDGAFSFVLGDGGAAQSSIIVNDGTFDVSGMTMAFKANGSVLNPDYTLIDYSGGGMVTVNGASIFGGVTDLPAGYEIQNDITNMQIKLVTIPEPGSMVLMVIGGLLTLMIRRMKSKKVTQS